MYESSDENLQNVIIRKNIEIMFLELSTEY